MEDKYLDIVTEISHQLGEINGGMKQVLNQLASHEQRITSLEKHPSNQVTFKDDLDLKNKAIKYLLIGLVAAISAIVSLTGSATILTKILGS